MPKYGVSQTGRFVVETRTPDGVLFSREYSNAYRAWRAFLQTKKPSASRPPGTLCQMIRISRMYEEPQVLERYQWPENSAS